MKESQVVTSLLKELRKHGFFWKASDRYVAGIPDIIGCVGGVFVALEIKIDKNTATPLQVYNIGKIREAGGFAEVVTYNNQTKKYITQNTEYSRKEITEWILRHLVSSTNESVSKQ